VFVAIISAMWSAPISIFVEWIIMKVLAAKTYETKVQISNLNALTSVGIHERMSHAMSHTFKKSLDEEVMDLGKEVKQYYETLSGREQEDFAGMNL
jgi:hypothetical protein